MKLNPDCIRDILFYVEGNTDLNKHVTFKSESPIKQLDNYSTEEILYHVKQCELSGFFERTTRNLVGDCTISYLSPAGHQFLSNIRSDNVWNDVKEISKKVGSNSLQAIVQIATSVITTIIQHQLGFTL